MYFAKNRELKVFHMYKSNGNFRVMSLFQYHGWGRGKPVSAVAEQPPTTRMGGALDNDILYAEQMQRVHDLHLTFLNVILWYFYIVLMSYPMSALGQAICLK